jgi:hypothetical protein
MVINCIWLLDKYLTIEYPKIPKEIIVVENGSTDNTYKALIKLKTKIPLIILKQNSNIGFAKAINLATNKAKYNYLYLINNDMEVQPGFFKNIINTANNLIKKKINFFGISSQIFFFNPTVKQVESGKTYINFKNGKLLVGHELNPQKLKNVSLTAYCGGGSSLINKKIFNLLGQYDYNVYTPLYCEDLDLGFVAWKKGYPSFFCPDSHVIHHHRSSSNLLSINPDYYIKKNYLAFCLKNFDNPSLALKLFFMYPIYLIFKKDYWQYLTDNLKNISNIIKSRNRLSKISNVYKDTDLINFTNFGIKNSYKYQI